jgi:DNA-binding transcriptional LysR family regulator
MSELAWYRAFIAVVEAGSLTAAARRSGVSVQSISRSLSAFETKLGITLVQRTTRVAAPTEQGLALYTGLRDGLATIDGALDETSANGIGQLRCAASPMFGARVLAPLTAAFVTANPSVHVHLVLSDDYADLARERIDVAIRIGVPALSALKARVMGRAKRVVFAAPSYLAARGAPERPEDLVHHDCVLRTTGGRTMNWDFGASKPRLYPVRGRFTSNHIQACIEAAVHGAGIGSAMLWQVDQVLASGALVEVLSDYPRRPMPVMAVWRPGVPSRRRTAFLDLLAASLHGRSL